MNINDHQDKPNKLNDNHIEFEDYNISDRIKLKMIDDINLIIETISIKLIRYIFSSNYSYFLNLKKVQDIYKVSYNNTIYCR